jgi:hypothetical protein
MVCCTTPLTLGYPRVTNEAELAILRVQSVCLLASARIIVQVSVSQIKTINTTQQQQTIGTAGRGIGLHPLQWHGQLGGCLVMRFHGYMPLGILLPAT